MLVHIVWTEFFILTTNVAQFVYALAGLSFSTVYYPNDGVLEYVFINLASALFNKIYLLLSVR